MTDTELQLLKEAHAELIKMLQDSNIETPRVGLARQDEKYALIVYLGTEQKGIPKTWKGFPVIVRVIGEVIPL